MTRRRWQPGAAPQSPLDLLPFSGLSTRREGSADDDEEEVKAGSGAAAAARPSLPPPDARTRRLGAARLPHPDRGGGCPPPGSSGGDCPPPGSSDGGGGVPGSRIRVFLNFFQIFIFLCRWHKHSYAKIRGCATRTRKSRFCQSPRSRQEKNRTQKSK